MLVRTRIITISRPIYRTIVLDPCQGCIEVDLQVSDLSLRTTDLDQVMDLLGLKAKEGEVCLRLDLDLHLVLEVHQEGFLEDVTHHLVEADHLDLCLVLLKVQVRPPVHQFSLHQRWLFLNLQSHHHSPWNLRHPPTMN